MSRKLWWMSMLTKVGDIEFSYGDLEVLTG
jgi:hypothetical protein